MSKPAFDPLWEGFYDIRINWNNYNDVVRIALSFEWTTTEVLKVDHRVLVWKFNEIV